MVTRFVGLDPSLTSFGVYLMEVQDGVVERELVHLIKTGPHEFANRFKRYGYILKALEPLLPGRDGLVAIETYSMLSQGSAVTKMVELGYAVRALMLHIGTPFIEVSPMTLKAVFTGMPSADKQRVRKAVEKKLGTAVKHAILEYNKASQLDLSDACGLGLIAKTVWYPKRPDEHKSITRLRERVYPEAKEE